MRLQSATLNVVFVQVAALTAETAARSMELLALETHLETLTKQHAALQVRSPAAGSVDHLS